MNYTYGDCCCGFSGWFDVYWPGASMGSDPGVFARTSNSVDFATNENTFNTPSTPVWDVSLSEDEDDGTWGECRSAAVTNSDRDEERVWVNYQNGSAEYVLSLIDCTNQTELQSWNETDYAFIRTWYLIPRNDFTGTGDYNYAAGVGLLSGSRRGAWGSVPVSLKRRNQAPCNGAVGFNGMLSINYSSGSEAWGYIVEDDGSVTQNVWTAPASPTWSSSPWPQAVSYRNWPKCAGVRTVWNKVPDAMDESYDFDIDIVYGEISSTTIQSMTASGTLKSWNYTGYSTYNANSETNKDNAWADAGEPLVWLTGYIEDSQGNRLVRYLKDITTSMGGVVGTEVLEYNGTELIADCNNVTITEDDGTTTHTGYVLVDAHIYESRGSFPSDTGDEIKLGFRYEHSSTSNHFLQLLDDTGASLWDFSSGPTYEFAGGQSDAYAYVRSASGGTSTLRMVRLDAAFEETRNNEPLTTGGGPSAITDRVDTVKLTALDDYTPPLAEADLT